VLSRRTFLKGGLAVAAGAALPFQGAQKAFAVAPAPPLTPFVDALPIPPVKTPVSPNTYQLTVQPISHSYHSSLPATPHWGYDGIYPGPTFVATRGTPISVQVTNNVTAGAHPFAASFDETIPGNIDDGRVAIHLHGGETAPTSDGNPMSVIFPGQSFTYQYGNAQRGTTVWYHDHAFGNTRLNVMAGLAGFYLLIDPAEEAAIVAANPGAGLPTLPYLIGLAIQDRDFFVDGSVDYPVVPDPGSGHFHWVPEYFANTACVNGKAMPHLDVEPRRYRFKVLNGSQARFYKLSLSNGAPITVIGSDGGYLAAPVNQASLLIAPGERYDVVIDFTGLAPGTNIVMGNDAAGPFPSGTLFTDSRTDTTMNVMQFRVNLPLSGVPNPPLPATLGDVDPVAVPVGTPVRSLFLNEVANSADVVERVMLNNTGSLVGPTEMPQVGATEVWEIANTTGDTHPIHLHLVQFRMIDRRAFRADDYRMLALGRLYEPPATPFITNGPTMMGHTPRPQEAAWKDTLLMHPGEVTRILVKFAPQDAVAVPGTNSFAFDPTVDPGYVWHCHILEHEENDMMRPLMPSNTSTAVATGITIRRSTARTELRRPFILSGELDPGKIGDGCIVEVKKPGSSRWSYSSLRIAGTQAPFSTPVGWWYRYMPTVRGLYSFRVRFPGDATRSASLSSVVTVRVV
jgi:spore coat protein A, manganese oxidase